LVPDFVHVAIVLAPIALLPLAGWIGGRRSAGLLALIPAALVAYFAYVFDRVQTLGPFTAGVPWAPGLGLSLSFHFDGLSLFFATLIAAVGSLIVLYASRYIDEGGGRFQVFLFAFMGSMLGLVLSDNLLSLFVFWELTGFTSYLLIGFAHDRRESRQAAMQALLVTAGGGLALLAAAVLIGLTTGTASLSALRAEGTTLTTHPWYGAIAGLVLLAAFTKSAQFPFHFWLPNAMQAPTPVSAYLHSATMVKAGVYLVARVAPLLGDTPLWTGALVLTGALTMSGGWYRAVLETDLKRILAYSTISALGVLMILFGLGAPQTVTAGLVYLLAHACYKGALFLVAGTLEHETGTRDVTALSGLRSAMPKTAVAAGLAAASMVGLPLFFGFVAKEQLYDSLSHLASVGVWPEVLLAASFAASAFLGAAALTAGIGPFIGPHQTPAGVHEAPLLLWLAPLSLAAAGLVLGSAPAIANGPVTLAAAAITGESVPVELVLWHGWTLTLLLSVLTTVATLTLFMYRGTVRRRAWPRALGTDRVYTGALAALDALSRRASPALQSASLRSYVLVVLTTAVVLVGTALADGRVLPRLSRWTPPEVHEVTVALLIAAAAVSAATARSNVAAVLSLGAVGYGVAVMYAFFGAPDLAMTQFAVETLTVVVFVLVFHRLRGFGELSSPLVRVRDALVAGTAGVLVTTLVLFIGASGTTSRLASYFAETAPSEAHGRNVVNVILVDFRGLDTMGEITVLVTVAVGVRALLLIGRERRS
jgi:multicomponent Na+:H+ antiporter subunit A